MLIVGRRERELLHRLQLVMKRLVGIKRLIRFTLRACEIGALTDNDFRHSHTRSSGLIRNRLSVLIPALSGGKTCETIPCREIVMLTPTPTSLTNSTGEAAGLAFVTETTGVGHSVGSWVGGARCAASSSYCSISSGNAVTSRRLLPGSARRISRPS